MTKLRTSSPRQSRACVQAQLALARGGIACFGDLTVGIAGVGTLYANGGLETTTMTVVGVSNLSALNVTKSVTRKTVVVNGGDDSQIDFSTADGAATPGATLYNDPYGHHFVVRLNAINRIDVEPNSITLNGSVACGAMTLDSILNLTTRGLASHIQLNASDRITLNQTNTTLHGDIVCGP